MLEIDEWNEYTRFINFFYSPKKHLTQKQRNMPGNEMFKAFYLVYNSLLFSRAAKRVEFPELVETRRQMVLTICRDISTITGYHIELVHDS